uniref:Uncharacterized protein n=1 Tax=Octopus bimaculoides TaxID=37653 RepID=A0A0L8HTB8_OCTBM
MRRLKNYATENENSAAKAKQHRERRATESDGTKAKRLKQMPEYARRRHPEEKEFANYPFDVGNGNISIKQSLGEFKIKLPNDLCLESGSLSDLCDFVYADLKNNLTNLVWLVNRTIVTPTNEAAQFVNYFLLTRIPEAQIQLIMKPNRVHQQTYSIRISTHSQNKDATSGHCNGTRYIIFSLYDRVIKAEIASEMKFPFTFTRKRFPVKPVVALTFNKAQKQTFEQIGIYLPIPFFSHGQLYVALSRVRISANVRVLAEENTNSLIMLTAVSTRRYYFNAKYAF